jgi:hypothetical protein
MNDESATALLELVAKLGTRLDEIYDAVLALAERPAVAPDLAAIEEALDRIEAALTVRK